MARTTRRRRAAVRAVAAAVVVAGVGVGTAGGAGAATWDGASAQCYGDSLVGAWAGGFTSRSDIHVKLPSWLAVGRTFVRYQVVPDSGPGFTTGWYWADNVGLPGPYGQAFNSGSRYWTQPDGTMLRYLSTTIGTTPPGTRHRVWQQRYVLANGRWSGGTWEHVDYIAC